MHANENSKFIDHSLMGFGKGLAEKFNWGCNIKAQVFGPDGKLKEESQSHNAVTSAGLAGVMDQILASPSLAKAGWMEIGTGSPGATLLGTALSRVALTSKTRSGAVVTFVGDWGAGVGTGTITEAGVFDVVTANTVNMWMSASFGAVTKGALDTLKITWTLTAS